MQNPPSTDISKFMMLSFAGVLQDLEWESVETYVKNFVDMSK